MTWTKACTIWLTKSALTVDPVSVLEVGLKNLFPCFENEQDLLEKVVLEFSFHGWMKVATWRWINDYRISILGELEQLQKEQNCISVFVTQSQQNLVMYIMRFAILKAFVSKASAQRLFTVWESQRFPQPTMPAASC